MTSENCSSNRFQLNSQPHCGCNPVKGCNCRNCYSSLNARYITLISTDTLGKFRLCQTCVLTSIEQYLCIVFFPGLCRSLCTTLSTNPAKFPCKLGTYIINFILFAHNTRSLVVLLFLFHYQVSFGFSF